MLFAIHHLSGLLRRPIPLLFILLPGLCLPLEGIGQTVAITELNYNSDSAKSPKDWVEIYNYGSASVDLTGWYLTDDNPYNVYFFPSGQTLAAGDFLVISTNLAAFSTVYPSVSNVIGEPTFRFANGGEAVNIFNSSATLVSSMVYEDTVPWPKGADGYGRTLQVLDPQGDLSDPENWIDGCMFGTPGSDYVPCDPPLVFSEINYNPPVSPDGGDWVELHNRSGSPFDLSGWILRDQRDTNDFFFPAGTVLNPDEYLVVGRDTTAFRALYDQVTNVIGDFPFNLSGDGEVVRIHQPNDEVFFSVVYNDAPPWPEEADGLGYTLEMIDPTAPMNEADNWFAGCLLGTPGQAYDPDCLLGLEEQPFPFRWELSSGSGSLMLFWPTEAGPGRASLFDISGRQLLAQHVVAGWNSLVGVIPEGTYIVIVRSSDGQLDARKVILH